MEVVQIGKDMNKKYRKLEIWEIIDIILIEMLKMLKRKGKRKNYSEIYYQKFIEEV